MSFRTIRIKKRLGSLKRWREAVQIGHRKPWVCEFSLEIRPCIITATCSDCEWGIWLTLSMFCCYNNILKVTYEEVKVALLTIQEAMNSESTPSFRGGLSGCTRTWQTALCQEMEQDDHLSSL